MDPGRSDDEEDAMRRATLEPAVSEQDAPISPKRKKNKKNGKPTRPLSAYNLFYRHERARWLESLQTDPTMKEIPPKERFLAMGRHIAQRWNELNEAEKQTYKQEAAPYYAEFLEAKKRYNAKKSKEGIAERQSLEEAAQKEMMRKVKEHQGTEPASANRLDNPRELSSIVDPNNLPFHQLPREDIGGTYASVMTSLQQQSVEALTALFGVPSRNAEAFLNASPPAGMNISQMAPTQQHHQAPNPSSLQSILEILQREQQQIWLRRLLASQQQGYTTTPSTEELQLALELARNSDGTAGSDPSVAAFLELLKRGNPSGF